MSKVVEAEAEADAYAYDATAQHYHITTEIIIHHHIIIIIIIIIRSIILSLPRVLSPQAYKKHLKHVPFRMYPGSRHNLLVLMASPWTSFVQQTIGNNTPQ